MSADRGPLDFGDEPIRGDEPVHPGGAADSPGGAPPPPEPARPTGASRYTWFLGVVAFLLVVVAILNSIGSEGVSPGGPDAGDRLVPFAVPLADAPPRRDDDANIDPQRACAVRGQGVLNICALAERGPVVFALFPTEGGRCREVLDQFARVAPRFDGVQFVAVGSRGDRDILRGRDDPFPVGFDRDGAVSSVYGLAGCPQITFARRGGDVLRTTRRPLSDSELAGIVRELQRDGAPAR